MARVNYRQLKQRREEAQRKEQAAKQQRKGRVPGQPADGAPAPPQHEIK